MPARTTLAAAGAAVGGEARCPSPSKCAFRRLWSETRGGGGAGAPTRRSNHRRGGSRATRRRSSPSRRPTSSRGQWHRCRAGSQRRHGRGRHAPRSGRTASAPSPASSTAMAVARRPGPAGRPARSRASGGARLRSTMALDAAPRREAPLVSGDAVETGGSVGLAAAGQQVGSALLHSAPGLGAERGSGPIEQKCAKERVILVHRFAMASCTTKQLRRCSSASTASMPAWPDICSASAAVIVGSGEVHSSAVCTDGSKRSNSSLAK